MGVPSICYGPKYTFHEYQYLYFFLLLSDVPADGNEPDVVVYAVVNKTKRFNAEFISENVPLSKKGKVLCV